MPLTRTLCLAIAAAQVLGTSPVGAEPLSSPFQLAESRSQEERPMQPDTEDADTQYMNGMAALFGQGARRNSQEGRQWLERAACRGHLNAQIGLGRAFEEGVGGPVDTTQALRWYREAAGQGDDKAAWRAGRLLRLTAHTPAETAEAGRWLLFAAESNDAEAHIDLALWLAAQNDAAGAIAQLERAASQDQLGRILLAELKQRRHARRSVAPADMLADWQREAGTKPDARFKVALAALVGIGRAIDEPAARAMLEPLARKGHAASAYFLAVSLAEAPEGSDTSWKTWMGRAADKGYGAAQLWMSRVEIMDRPKSLAWLKKAAEQGLPEAQEQYGLRLDDRDHQQGRAWLLKAARQGNARAAYDLTMGPPGISFTDGSISDEEMKWLRQAADGGVSEAQTQLGQHLAEDGKVAEGLPWLQKAARHGDSNAAVALGDLYREGKHVAKDFAQAGHWYRRAYDLRNPNGMYRLNWMLTEPEAPMIQFAEVLPVFQQEAAKGEEFGLIAMGRVTLRGWGVPRDPAAALKYFKAAAAKNGYETAFVAIGDMYAEGDGVPRDDAMAVSWYRQAFAHDPVAAKVRMARMLRDGRGTAQDVPQAIKLLEEASNRGHGEAAYELGLMYEQGLGVPVDLEKARQFMSRAASDHDARAEAHLKDYVTVNGQVRLGGEHLRRQLRQRAKAGDAQAQFELASTLIHADTEQEQDVEGGLRWLTRAAEQGLVPAQVALAALYAQGINVRRAERWEVRYRDAAAAVRWYREAAKRGDAQAQLVLARPTEEGGVDPAEALHWALEAAKAEKPEAAVLLVDDFARGRGTPPDMAQAIAWAEKAAQLGRPEGYMSLAACFSEAHDPTSAFTWNLKAADAGDKDAMQAVAEAYEQGLGTPKNLRAAAEWWGRSAEPYDSGHGGFSAARLYLLGPAEVHDEAQALRWYLTGIEDWIEGGDGTEIYGQGEFAAIRQRYGNLAAAQVALGDRFERGDGLPRDREQARTWYARAARFDTKYPEVAMLAHLKLAAMGVSATPAAGLPPKNHLDEGLRLLRSSAAGPFQVIERLPSSWEFNHGFPSVVAALWQAADAGYAPAQYQMGWLLSTGRAVPRNGALAQQWMKRAADKGYVPARLELAGQATVQTVAALLASEAFQPDRLQATLHPTPQPAGYDKAVKELERAMKAGKLGQFAEKPSMNFSMVMVDPGDEPLDKEQIRKLARSQGVSEGYLTFIFEAGRLGALARRSHSQAERLKWWLQGAELGDPAAMSQLAEAYLTGDGVAKDRVAAVQWHTLAMVGGVPAQLPDEWLTHVTDQERAKGEAAATAWWTKRHGVSLAP